MKTFYQKIIKFFKKKSMNPIILIQEVTSIIDGVFFKINNGASQKKYVVTRKDAIKNDELWMLTYPFLIWKCRIEAIPAFNTQYSDKNYIRFKTYFITSNRNFQNCCKDEEEYIPTLDFYIQLLREGNISTKYSFIYRTNKEKEDFGNGETLDNVIDLLRNSV